MSDWAFFSRRWQKCPFIYLTTLPRFRLSKYCVKTLPRFRLSKYCVTTLPRFRLSKYFIATLPRFRLSKYCIATLPRFRLSLDHIEHNNVLIGLNKIQINYKMSNQQLLTTDQQGDLGIITKDLKWQKQTKKSWKTANRVLGFIASNCKYKNKELNLPLYKSLVRPHLERAVQFWSPHLRRDIDKIERYREEQQICFLKSETTATTSESRTLISSVLYREDCKDSQLKCFNTWIDWLQPVQEGSSIMTLMIEQETMEQNLL